MLFTCLPANGYVSFCSVNGFVMNVVFIFTLAITWLVLLWSGGKRRNKDVCKKFEVAGLVVAKHLGERSVVSLISDHHSV